MVTADEKMNKLYKLSNYYNEFINGKVVEHDATYKTALGALFDKKLEKIFPVKIRYSYVCFSTDGSVSLHVKTRKSLLGRDSDVKCQSIGITASMRSNFFDPTTIAIWDAFTESIRECGLPGIDEWRKQQATMLYFVIC